jgi:hypothetical protein
MLEQDEDLKHEIYMDCLRQYKGIELKLQAVGIDLNDLIGTMLRGMDAYNSKKLRQSSSVDFGAMVNTTRRK